MKKITKMHQPSELKQWLYENREGNHDYDSLKGHPAHAALKKRLLHEQGFLCAYTGKRINKDSAHIEHVKPQTTCAEWEDVDYHNVVACFPKEGGDESYGYGAPMKKGWWEECGFVSPLCEDCERKLQFAWSGRVHPFPDNDTAATQTINVLKLNEKKLVEERHGHIKGYFGFSKKFANYSLSQTDARILLEKIYNKNTAGEFVEFCFALKQLLPKYIAGSQL